MKDKTLEKGSRVIIMGKRGYGDRWPDFPVKEWTDD